MIEIYTDGSQRADRQTAPEESARVIVEAEDPRTCSPDAQPQGAGVQLRLRPGPGNQGSRRCESQSEGQGPSPRSGERDVFSLPQPFGLFKALSESMGRPPWEGQSALLSPPIQMLISPQKPAHRHTEESGLTRCLGILWPSQAN